MAVLQGQDLQVYTSLHRSSMLQFVLLSLPSPRRKVSSRSGSRYETVESRGCRPRSPSESSKRDTSVVPPLFSCIFKSIISGMNSTQDRQWLQLNVTSRVLLDPGPPCFPILLRLLLQNRLSRIMILIISIFIFIQRIRLSLFF